MNPLKTLLISLSVVVWSFFGATAYAQEVTGLNLINADSDNVIGPLVDGAELNLATLPTRNLSIQALAAGVGSVRFGLDGNPNFQTETSAPYALNGDSGGDYAPWTPTIGAHTVTATAFSGAGGSGTAGTPFVINFTVIDDDEVIDPPLPMDGVYLEDNGLVVMDVESQLAESPWSLETSIPGFLGSGYFIGGADFFNQPGNGTVTYQFRVNTSGRYQLAWRSRISVDGESTEYNDSWARITNNAGNPVSPVSNSNTITQDWYKVYLNTESAWTWDASNTDNNPRSLSWNLTANTEYSVQISVRSDGHALDRIVLWDHARHNLANKTTGKGSNNSALDALPLSSLAGGISESAVLQTTAPGIYGDLMRWHRVTVAFEGPTTSENAATNPFLDYRLNVNFTHSVSGNTFTVPGYYAADGQSGETSATGGKIWRVHFAPPETGVWNYSAQFRQGTEVAVSDDAAPGIAAALNGETNGEVSGSFVIAETDKVAPDNRARGELDYIGERYLRFAGTGEYFLKQGADAPENLLAYEDFDGNFKSDGTQDNRIKSYAPHAGDWKVGDPSWQNGKGTELIGAITYLADKGMNVFSFLTMNIAGDDENVFPYVNSNDRTRIDVSRMDQWEVIFRHGKTRGMYLHFKTQETENELLLDGGALGVQRKLYYRELIARFSHNLVLNWNLGEESSDQTTAQRKEMAQYFHDHDPYGHHIVIHTYPNEKNLIYTPLLGNDSKLTGASIQTSRSDFADVHKDVLEWVKKSGDSGKNWVVAVDESGGAQDALLPDADDADHDIPRHEALWGTLLAGGAGNEYYFGYARAESDLTLEDFRSRDLWWDQCRHALQFFSDHSVPFWEMTNANQLIGNGSNASGSAYCFAKEGSTYVVYLPDVEEKDLDLSGQTGNFTVQWFNPRAGGELQVGSVTSVSGGSEVSIGLPPAGGNAADDWVALVRSKGKLLFIRGADRSGGFFEATNDTQRTEQLADINNNATTGGNHGWGELKTLLETEGYELTQFAEPIEAGAASTGPTTGAPLNLAALDLSQYAAIVFGSNNAVYSGAQIDALESYIREGGSAVFISDANFGSDWCDAPNSDQQFLDRFGLVMNQDQGEYTVDRAQGEFIIPDHPIFAGVDTFMGEGVSPGFIPTTTPPAGVVITRLAAASGATRNNDGTPGVNLCQGSSRQTTSQDGSLIVASVDSGRVAIHFDRNTFFNKNGAGTDITEHDNTRYARNLFNWLASRDDLSTDRVTAVISASPTTGEAPLDVAFNGSASNSTRGPITSYEWDFEDDGVFDATGATVTRSFTGGTFTTRLRVSDGTDTAETTIQISAQTQESFGNNGFPWSVPGLIEAENFDVGGSLAYFDTTSENIGGEYRPDEAVDIEPADDDGGGFNIGYTDPGEWLEYTVSVAETATYTLDIRVAGRDAGGAVRLFADGVDKTGLIEFEATGDWQDYQTVTSEEFTLTAGTHVIRLLVVVSNFNLNWLRLNAVGIDFNQFIAGFPTLTGDDALASADPDGDGMENIVEQWLGLDPTQPDINSDRLPKLTLGASPGLSFTYDGRVVGGTLELWTAENLANWTKIDLEPQWINPNGDLREVVVPVELIENKRFWHLRIEP